MKRAIFLIPAILLGALIGVILVTTIRIGDWVGGADPETIAQASLRSMQEQSRLTTFAASYVAVVTSTQQRFGLTARKTLIMPGQVRYEVDLSRLRQQDVRWDAASKTLSVRLPPVDVAQPQIDVSRIQEYGDGGVLMTLTDAEQQLDAANRRQAQIELLRQARQPMPMRLARESAKRAIARSFAMPLRAAGIDANVEVRFLDEGTDEPSYLDRSRRIEDVLDSTKERGR